MPDLYVSISVIERIDRALACIMIVSPISMTSCIVRPKLDLCPSALERAECSYNTSCKETYFCVLSTAASGRGEHLREATEVAEVVVLVKNGPHETLGKDSMLQGLVARREMRSFVPFLQCFHPC